MGSGPPHFPKARTPSLKPLTRPGPLAAGSPSQQALPSLAALTSLGLGPLQDSSPWPHHTWWILCPCLLGQAPHTVTCYPQNYLAKAQDFRWHCFSGPATSSCCRLDCHLSTADRPLKVTSRNPQNGPFSRAPWPPTSHPQKHCPGDEVTPSPIIHYILPILSPQ